MLCPKGLHEIRGPLDIGDKSECVQCVRDRGHRYAADRSAALKLYRGLAKRGIPLDPDLLARGYQLLAEHGKQC